MFPENTQLKLDVKAQDRLREWFAQRNDAEVDNLVLTCLSLGDSDVDYKLSDKVDQIRVLNAPYNVERIKHKLIFRGSNTNLTGTITAFARYVNQDGTLSSLYEYPPSSETFLPGIFPPSVENGFDQSELIFQGGLDATREGYVLFFQTLPDGFFVGTGEDPTQLLRLVEPYDITIENMPSVKDVTNATNSTPITIVTQQNHNLSLGDEVAISGVQGNLAANGLFTVTPTGNSKEFRLDGSSGSGDYEGGGKVYTWHANLDLTNGSMLLAKTNIDLKQGPTNPDGVITIKGLLSGITKTITFNY